MLCKPSRISYPTSSVQAGRRKEEDNETSTPATGTSTYGLRLAQCSSRSHTLSISLDSAVSCTALRTAVNSRHLNAFFCKCSSRLQLKERTVPVRWNGPSSSMYKSEQASTGPLPAQTSTSHSLRTSTCTSASALVGHWLASP
jgi:hypothetical protein